MTKDDYIFILETLVQGQIDILEMHLSDDPDDYVSVQNKKYLSIIQYGLEGIKTPITFKRDYQDEFRRHNETERPLS